MNWVYLILGLWTFISPWVFKYTDNTGGMWSSLIVGLVVFLVAVYEMSASNMGRTSTQSR